jgi:hypothetical protein
MSARVWIHVKGGRLNLKQARKLMHELQRMVAASPRSRTEVPPEWRGRLESFLAGFCACAQARGYEVTPASLIGPARREPLNRLRQMAMAMALEFDGCSQATVGAFFGGRDHGTVYHAQRAVKNRLLTDAEVARELVAWRYELMEPRAIALKFAAGNDA